MTKLEVLDQSLYGNSNVVFNGKPNFPQIWHRVEYIKFVIYGIVKKIILKIQILYLIDEVVCADSVEAYKTALQEYSP
jgi:hypothetical protein